MNELEAKVQKLETLLSVAKELTSQLDLDKLLDTIMKCESSWGTRLSLMT
ncbi:hypothetical protein J7M22_04170 [Candidatus Poribacteria bacterium]|nr:hypothetical protein [Candidatus Poribacteria bacterium]